jgi:plasmid stability protein
VVLEGAEQMAQILVRGLDDAMVACLKDRARQNHRSLQGEVRAILEEAAPPTATRSEDAHCMTGRLLTEVRSPAGSGT